MMFNSVNNRFLGITFLGAMVLFISSIQSASGSTITYSVINQSVNTWEYNYSIFNDTLGVDIEEFTVYFEASVFESLAVGSAPAGWDPVAVEPTNDPFDPDGYYDAFALSATPIAPGDSLGGFTVTFDYLLSGTPGSQFFEIVMFNNSTFDFDVIDSGQTIAASVVPVPAAIWLFGTALVGLVRFSKRRKAV